MLKYLFKAEYKDGSFFEQNPDDISTQDSKRSAFFDVKLDQVKRFSLISSDSLVVNNVKYVDIFTVDLTDGHFEINDMPFKVHDNTLEVTDFKLIFFRRHKHSINVVENEFDESSKTHVTTYRLGWQAKDKKGLNHERVIEFK